MKFRVLALDYDGTIAQDGILDPDVKSAILEARARGIVVVLVTGRILSDLKRLMGDLSFFDAIVAENGAVLSFLSGHSRVIGQTPPAAFQDELRRRGLEFLVGQSIVECDANCAPQVLAAIRQLELPLLILFNRGRLMVLPQSVSKGIGLRTALATLRLSVHNAIGIGDAENDHDLLSTCELGVAVGWGSQALKDQADEILEGEGPRAVARYIRQVAEELRLPPERMGRYRLNLGTDENGWPLAVAVRGRNVLIAGEIQSGKSWVAGLACEQMILLGYSICVIDPEGDYRTLESLPGVVVFNGEDSPPELPAVARALRHPDMSVVIDLSHIAYSEKVEYLYTLLPMLAALRRSSGLPHRIVLDEAHYFLHEPNIHDLLDLNLGAYTLVTYRLSDLHPEVRKAIEAIVVKRITDPDEVQALISMAGHPSLEAEWRMILANLTISEAAVLPRSEEARGKLRRFELLPRLTSHVRHKAKYLDIQLVREQAFLFTDNGKPMAPPVRALKDFIKQLKTLPVSVLAAHARRGDFSSWLGGVFHDHLLASDVRQIEQRCRLGRTENLSTALINAIVSRYEFSPESFREDAP
ncbi:MAG TPA: HAD family hydrolase [Candidatus Acidoferrales bacterium]|nr:HAD family hydrolase [Candidatus Acidoferrales bacterium]